MNMVDTIKQRPTGWLGTLFDEVAHISDDPIVMLEEIAQQSFQEGSIDQRRLMVLQYRIPLPGFERENLDEVGRIISGTPIQLSSGEIIPKDSVTYQMVGLLEKSLYPVLREYIPLEQEEINSLDLRRLPWRRNYGSYGMKVCNILANYLQHQDRPETIGGVIESFNKDEKIGEILTGIKGFTPLSLEMIYAVFRQVNVELPTVTVYLAQ